MAYIQVEASVRTHRKFLKAGPAASWLWLCGVGYCQDGLTDGFIPFEAIDYLGVKPATARKLKSKLVDVGLWVDVPGGWRVHDYLKSNRSAAEIRATKDRRRAGGSLGGRPPKETSNETLQETSEVLQVVNLPVNHPENPSQIISSHQISATATAGRSGPLHTTHKGHAICGRVCLIAQQYREFVGRRNHPNAEAEIDKWAIGVLDEWTSGAKGNLEPGESFEFWKARYAEQWPAASAAPAGKPKPAWWKPAAGSQS